MDFWQSLAGRLRIRLRSADPAQVLKLISENGVHIQGITPAEDAITLTFWIPRLEYPTLERLVRKKGLDMEVIGRGGLYWSGIRMLHRPVLLLGLAILLFLCIYLPSRVLFFQVEGNRYVPTNFILEQCQQVGIRFGASRSEVRSERVKNALLEVIPQLQWVGVNTSGCVATVTVKERPLEDPPEQTFAFSSIVAARDGVITGCTASSGNLLCRPGQAVKKGQVLISGYNDYGLTIQLTQAQGEVYARTSREFSVLTPAISGIQSEKIGSTKKYAIIIGKKRINFYKGSGISGTTCDKMYSERYLTLPGGFQLPICLVTEVWTQYQCSPHEADADRSEQLLKEFADNYLPSVMIAGKVLQSTQQITKENDAYLLSGNYACLEMIGREVSEEIITPDGKHD